LSASMLASALSKTPQLLGV